MIRVARYAVSFVGSLVVLGVGSLLLFWLGRPIEEQHGELVVDPDIDFNDAGIDVDEEDRHP